MTFGGSVDFVGVGEERLAYAPVAGVPAFGARVALN